MYYRSLCALFTMADSVVVVPVPKKSSDMITDYIIYFERLATANGWDDTRKAAIFPSLLEIGCKALDGMSDLTLASFALIKKALVGESEPYRESNMTALWNMSRNSNDTLTQHKERIAGLVEKVYPKFAASNKQLLIRDIFVHSLSHEYQRFLLSAPSLKIEDALNAALMYESMKPKNVEYKNFKIRAQHNVKKYDAPKKNVSEETCHFCQKKGHYARDCYKKKLAANKINVSSKSVESMTAKYFVALQIGNNIEEMSVYCLCPDIAQFLSLLPRLHWLTGVC